MPPTGSVVDAPQQAACIKQYVQKGIGMDDSNGTAKMHATLACTGQKMLDLSSKGPSFIARRQALPWAASHNHAMQGRPGTTRPGATPSSCCACLTAGAQYRQVTATGSSGSQQQYPGLDGKAWVPAYSSVPPRQLTQKDDKMGDEIGSKPCPKSCDA